MRITTKLNAISAVMIAALMVLVPVLTWSIEESSRARSDLALIDDIQSNFFERTAFRDQYFVHSEDRTRIQWDENKALSDQLLSQAKQQFQRADDLAMLERLRLYVDDTAVLFHRVVANRQSLDAGAGNREVRQELDKRLSSQLLLKASSVRDSVMALKSAGARRVELAYKNLALTVALLTGTLAIITLLVSASLVRFVRQRLAPLHEGAKTIGDGDLAYRIKTTGADEFSNLAQSINAMTDTLVNEIGVRKQAEADLRVAATVFEAQEGMLVTDADQVVLRVNQAFADITGYAAQEVVGQTPRLLKSGRHGADFYAGMWQEIREQGVWRGEIWNRRKSGEVYPQWLMITAVKGDDGEVTHYVATLNDITLRKAAEETIKDLAFYDPLTHLPNRRLLHDRLHQALAFSARSGREGALLFIDLDDFKSLNDTLGHDVGDLLLKQVGERLAACVREGDTVARLGGDEFVVMLEDLSPDPQVAAKQTDSVGAKIIAALNQPYPLGGQDRHSTASIGATLFNEHLNAVDELFKRADMAMYQAKAAGRNRLTFFNPELQAAVDRRVLLEAELRQGLQECRLLLYYQAQVDAADRVIGAEALVRWQHPERGIVAPDYFIPLAEETGLILPLGLWVLESACAQLAAWSDPALADLTLAVNVSAQQLHQADFVAQVLTVVARTGADPRRLKLELTESRLMNNVEDSIAKMTALKAAGVRFALDDFGTGYSSLAYLKRLPLEKLKIDRSFVRDVLVDPNDAAIAHMIVTLAQSLDLGVIAEGVETQEQRDFLLRHGCHNFQGYLFSRPVPVAEFEALARRSYRAAPLTPA